jgi:hypothetical protein
MRPDDGAVENLNQMRCVLAHRQHDEEIPEDSRLAQAIKPLPDAAPTPLRQRPPGDVVDDKEPQAFQE